MSDLAGPAGPMDLRQRFVAALDDVDLPERDLVEPILSAILEPAERTARWPRPWSGTPWWTDRGRRLVAALAAAVVATAVIVIVPPTRHAVARWLGIGATDVDIVSGTGPLPSTPSAEELGVAVDGATDPIPALGPPEQILDHPVRGRSYRWGASEALPPLGSTDAGLVLSVRRVTGDEALSYKSVAGDADVEIVSVEPRGRPPAIGLWIGAEHDLVAGSFPPVLAQRVLLWTVDQVEYRLEGDLTLTRMLELAASVEGGTDLLPPG